MGSIRIPNYIITRKMSKKTSGFYDKCSSMLVSIESCRSAGSLEPSIAKFTTLIDEITEFLEESDEEDEVDEDVEEEEEYCVMELIRMRGVASYQLALTVRLRAKPEERSKHIEYSNTPYTHRPSSSPPLASPTSTLTALVSAHAY